MNGQVFVIQGDITAMRADALAYSTYGHNNPGLVSKALQQNVEGFSQAFDDAFKDRDKRLAPGKALWLPLPHSEDMKDTRPRGVVVVGVIKAGVEEAEISDKAVKAAIKAAAEHLPPPPCERRMLIALTGFRMGDAHRTSPSEDEAWGARRKAAVAQVKAAQEALADYPGVDVVFVTYTPDLYHLYLNARREIFGTPPSAPLPVPAKLAQAIRDGECVLFIGSGLSAGAGMPSWQTLVGKFAAKLKLPETPQGTTDYYLDVAQLYRHRYGQEGIGEVIQEEFGEARAKPTMAHYLLMALGVRHVITTNYDTLLEQALTALRRDPVKIISEAGVALTGETGAHFVIKFHGDATGSSDALVLSRADYEDFFHAHPAMTALLEGLLLNQTFLFVGYSLSDPNFRQIYSRIARILSAGGPETSKRMAYATQFDADASDLTREVWKSRQLQLLDIPGQGDEKHHNLLRFLDRLAAATLDEPKLFLSAPPNQTTRLPALAGLRDTLKSLGAEIKAAATQNDLSAEEVRQLGSTLAFLTRHGWRPSVQESAWRIWQQLANQCADDPSRKRMMLREALKLTERLEDAETIRAELKPVQE